MNPVYKGRDGWRAEDLFDMPEIGMQMKVYTTKSSSGNLVTYAVCHKVDGLFQTHRMFHDFSNRVASTGLRCTEKNVRQQQHEAVTMIDELKKMALAHYKEKGEYHGE